MPLSIPEDPPFPQRKRRLPDKRVQRMAALYSQGATLEEIGREFSLTRERVRQIMRRDGYDPGTLKAGSARARRGRAVAAHETEVRAHLAVGQSPQAVASSLGLSLSLVRSIDLLTSQYAETRRLSRSRTVVVKYTDDEVLDCLHVASSDLGGVLTASEYGEFSADRTLHDGRPWPGNQTAQLRFGTWRSALEAAGLESNPSSPILGRQSFSDAHCIDALIEVRRLNGSWPTARGYEAYAEKLDGLLPSAATIRHRFGGWQRALQEANAFLNSEPRFGGADF